MAVYFVIKEIISRRFPVRSVLLLIACLAVIAAIRLYVVHDFTYKDISGIGSWERIVDNLTNYYRSWHQVFFTVGIFVPFVIVSWKESAGPVKTLVLFLFPVLLLTHIIIGFLWETRNLIPVAIPMALMTANYLLGSGKETATMTIDRCS
jgi:hypothetical protein